MAIFKNRNIKCIRWNGWPPK